MTFHVEVHTDGNAVRLRMTGDLNATADIELLAAHAQAVTEDPRTLVLDFADVDYMNSSGIALIITLLIEARGNADCKNGAKCLAIFWVNGHTQIVNLAAGAGPTFYEKAEFTLAGANDHQLTVVLLTERDVKQQELNAEITLDSLDLTISPPDAAGRPQK